MRSTPPARRVTGVSVMTLIGVLVAMVLGTANAAAVDTYRSWYYYQIQGNSWTFAAKGPASLTPPDGSVEGWRWAVAGADSRPPRATASFAEICKNTPATAGSKRVGVVLDYGRAADAESGTPPQPRAACAQVPTAATGMQVLAKVATTREQNRLVCGLDQWPAAGCGGLVSSPSAAQKAPDEKVALAMPSATDEAKSAKDSGTPIWTIVAIAAVAAALLLAAALLARRRKNLERA